MKNLIIAVAVLGIAWKFKDMKDFGSQAAGAAFDLVDGVVSGSVVRVGEVVGVPATNQTQCQMDMAAGRTWAASFSCPAKDFLGYVFN